MPKIKPFLFGSLCGACLTFVALRYHVVRYDEGVLMVARAPQPAVRSAYVDIRDWGAAMWKQYPEIAIALTEDGHGRVVAEKAAAELLGQPETDHNASSKAPLTSLLKPARETPPPIRLRTSLRPMSYTSRPTAQEAAGFEDVSVDERSFVIRSGPPEETSLAKRPEVEAPSRLASALESLFAPYDPEPPAAETPPAADAAVTVSPAESTAPQPPVNPRSSIPARPASRVAPPAPETFMQLKSLDVDLGQPVPLDGRSAAPRQAETTPRQRPTASGPAPNTSSEPI
jgi:hypothetical protein